MEKAIIQQLFDTERLIFGISEVGKIAQVTPRQLRYWEQKHYIHATQNAKQAREFRLNEVIKIILIKHFLDEGYTLGNAVEKVKYKIEISKKIRQFVLTNFNGIESIDERDAINLGFFNAEQTEILYGFIDGQSPTYCVKKSEKKTLS